MPETTPPWAADLMDYFVTRERQRANAVEETLAAMTDRERLLVREAAVMGNVCGMNRATAGYSERPAPDSAVLAEVVDACLALPDLYPTITSLTDPPATQEADRA